MQKKLSLTDLKVTSFTTTLNRDRRATLVAGNIIIKTVVETIEETIEITKVTEGPDSAARSCLHACATHEYCSCGGCNDGGR